MWTVRGPSTDCFDSLTLNSSSACSDPQNYEFVVFKGLPANQITFVMFSGFCPFSKPPHSVLNRQDQAVWNSTQN